MVEIAGSTFPTGKANKITSPPAIPVIPMNVEECVLFILEQWLFLQGGVITGDFQNCPECTPRRGLKRERKLESMHGISQLTICIVGRKFVIFL